MRAASTAAGAAQTTRDSTASNHSPPGSDAPRLGSLSLSDQVGKMSVLSYFAGAALTALIAYLIVVGEPILLPFVIAGFVAHLVNALAELSCAVRIRGKPLPGSVRFGLAILVLLLLSWALLNLVIRNVGYVFAAAPGYERNLQQVANQIGDLFGLDEVPGLQTVFEGLQVSNLIRTLASGLKEMVGSIGTVLLYVTFILLEQHSFPRKIAALFPDREREERVHRMLHRMGDEIQTYVWLKTVISLLAAGGTYVVLKLVGVDLAEFWALLTFALNFIPYIGAWLSVIFPSVLSLLQFGALGPFFATVGGLSVVQFTTGSILEPRVMGQGLNLSPVVMLLALAVWGTVWGVVGMFLAVPLMVVIMIVCSYFEATRPIAILMSANGELRT
jgi:AI-2 transport protein TqsA